MAIAAMKNTQITASRPASVPVNRERETFVPLQHYFNRMWSDLVNVPSMWSNPLLGGWVNGDFWPASISSMMSNLPFIMKPYGFIEPALDITETDKAFNVSVELPGLCEGDVDVSINSNYLNIKGKKEQQYEEESENCISRERYYGSFERSLALPQSVNADKVRAIFRDGILTIELPKKVEAAKESRKVEIKQAA